MDRGAFRQGGECNGGALSLTKIEEGKGLRGREKALLELRKMKAVIRSVFGLGVNVAGMSWNDVAELYNDALFVRDLNRQER